MRILTLIMFIFFSCVEKENYECSEKRVYLFNNRSFPVEVQEWHNGDTSSHVIGIGEKVLFIVTDVPTNSCIQARARRYTGTDLFTWTDGDFCFNRNGIVEVNPPCNWFWSYNGN